MKKIAKWLGIVFLIIFITAQFFQPEKNNQPISENHLFNVTSVPAPVKESLRVACLDCHSNQTNYLWYHHISPVSMMVKKHIDNGKKELNFSEWNNLSTMDKIGLLNKICEETKDGGMPLGSYTLMHKAANLTDEQITELCSWAETYGMEIYKTKM